ncbi:hypothetical protein D3C85_1112410 [compost metagenome]
MSTAVIQARSRVANAHSALKVAKGLSKNVQANKQGHINTFLEMGLNEEAAEALFKRCYDMALADEALKRDELNAAKEALQEVDPRPNETPGVSF